jgi:hypothetical protein
LPYIHAVLPHRASFYNSVQPRVAFSEFPIHSGIWFEIVTEVARLHLPRVFGQPGLSIDTNSSPHTYPLYCLIHLLSKKMKKFKEVVDKSEDFGKYLIK